MNRNIIIQVEFGLIMKFKKFPFSITKADLLLFLLLAATGIVPFLLQTAHGSGEQGTLIAVVTVDGETYGIYPLEVDQTIEIVRAEGTDDERRNTLVIENGSIRMEYSNCKNQICVHSGEKHGRGEQIVCLPNWVYVEVMSAGGDPKAQDEGFDAVAR